jgi:hypothetical protein
MCPNDRTPKAFCSAKESDQIRHGQYVQKVLENRSEKENFATIWSMQRRGRNGIKNFLVRTL